MQSSLVDIPLYRILDGTNFVIREPTGNVTATDGSSILWDQYSDVNKFSTNSVLVDFDQLGVEAQPILVTTNALVLHDPITGNPYSVVATMIEYVPTANSSSPSWNVGDRFGTDLMFVEHLPAGMYFDNPNGCAIIFNPDGTIDASAISGYLTVREKIGQNTTTNYLKWQITCSQIIELN